MDGVLSGGSLLEQCRVRSTRRGRWDQRWKLGGKCRVGLHNVGGDNVWNDPVRDDSGWNDIRNDSFWRKVSGFHDLGNHAVGDEADRPRGNRSDHARRDADSRDADSWPQRRSIHPDDAS